MELNPPGTPVPDAFFAAVRRRHPDVDIVLLPPELPTSAEPVSDEVVTDALTQVTAQARQLWAAAAPDADPAPEALPTYGAEPGSVEAVVRVSVHSTSGLPALLRLRHELESHGWEVARLPGGIEGLSARLGDLELRASYAEETGALLMRLASASLHVGQDRARALVRAGDR